MKDMKKIKDVAVTDYNGYQLRICINHIEEVGVHLSDLNDIRNSIGVDGMDELDVDELYDIGYDLVLHNNEVYFFGGMLLDFFDMDIEEEREFLKFWTRDTQDFAVVEFY